MRGQYANGNHITLIGSLPFWAYFVLITLAEILTIYLNPVGGVVAYIVIMVACLVISIFIRDLKKRNLTIALSLIPLVRIVSLSMPLSPIPLIYWFPLIYIPLLGATAVVMWVTHLKPSQVGFNFSWWPVQLSGGIITGFAFGTIEYLILRPNPLIGTFSLAEIWLPALILICTTGLVEELMFRGVLLRFAISSMGWQGLVLVSLIFAILHLGFYSFTDVAFVLAIALIYAVVVTKTGSIFGVILSHGVANCTLYLIAPFILGQNIGHF